MNNNPIYKFIVFISLNRVKSTKNFLISKIVSSAIFKVFGMKQPGIANTLPTKLHKWANFSQERPEGSLFNSYYTEV